MIDLHAHILYGLDDGIQTFEDSIEVIKEAKEAGFEKIVCTTHNSDKYTANERARNSILRVLKKEDLGVELFLGNELYVASDLIEKLKKKKASPINKSKYVLFEMPLHDYYPELLNLVIDMQTSGYKLILAHPERYSMFRRNPKAIEEILELGVYLQANYLSIEGLYGPEAKKMVKFLYKHNMISFLGTDVHTTKVIYPNVKSASKKIIDIVGEEKFEKMSNSNIEKVLANKEVEPEEYIRIKKNLFGKYV